ncbi:MAG: undecaprenyl-diphosphate phosphatase [Candidatus Binatia bacterium]
MLSAWQAVILGLVEGITEYLPVSSTGHLILVSSLLGLDHPATRSALDAYLIVVQGGAILAVLGLYRARVAAMVRGLLGRDAAGRRLLVNLLVAFVPAAVLGLLFDHAIDAWLFRPWPVLAALAVGGVWMIRLGARPGATGTVDAMAWTTALGIGFCQAVALWPGTSRSMTTIAGGMLLGLRITEAAEFSFLLGLPTLGAACAFKLLQAVRHAANGEPSMFAQLGATSIVLGLLIAALSAALAVRWLVRFLTRHGLAPFGWYRIALTGALVALVLAGTLHIG